MPKRRKGKTRIVQMGFRCAAWLSDKIHAAAAARGSSVNSEIARRLEASLLADEITLAITEERERCAAIVDRVARDWAAATDSDVARIATETASKIRGL